MLRLFWLVLILGGISVLFAQVLKAYGPGYVLFYYNHYSIETSVWVFLLLWVWLVLVLGLGLVLGLVLVLVLGTAQLFKVT